jgi:protein-tyrosine phosphatase
MSDAMAHDADASPVSSGDFGGPGEFVGAGPLLFICTGNATRSVIAGVLAARAYPGRVVRTAGTFVIEGQPVSWRTRRALEALEITADTHRSTQLTEEHLAEAAVVVALACEHVAYIRRNHPEAAGKTATLHRLAATLADGPAPLADRVAALGLAEAVLDPSWEDVADPGGCEVEEYLACAAEIDRLMSVVLPRLRG